MPQHYFHSFKRENNSTISQVAAAYLLHTRSQQTLFCIEFRQHLNKLLLPSESTQTTLKESVLTASEDNEFFTLIRLASFTQIARVHWIFTNCFVCSAEILLEAINGKSGVTVNKRSHKILLEVYLGFSCYRLIITYVLMNFS